MDPLKFYATLAEYLAWPLVVLVVVFTLSRPLRRLIDGIVSVEVSPGSVKMRRGFREATKSTMEAIEELKDSPPILSADPEPTGAGTEGGDVTSPKPAQPEELFENRNPWLTTVERSPAIAILESWEGLREAVFDLAEQTTPSRDPVSTRLQLGLSEILDELTKSNVVNPSFISAVDDLRELRNQVANGRSNPSQPEALAFITSCWELIRACRAIALLLSRRGKPREP